MPSYTIGLTDDEARAYLATWDGLELTTYPTAAARLADAIRANPPKPPRMAEPGPWGVVLANINDWRSAWVRDGARGPWVSTTTGARADWDELDDPQLVREGVKS